MNRVMWNHNGAYSQEFDWLVIDKKGQLGIFTATMNAPIPDIVKSLLENYEELRKRIESMPKIISAVVVTREKGNFTDWIVYAEKGFFCV